MSMYPDNTTRRTLDYGFAETGEQTRLLTSFFHNVYLWMSVGLVWSAIISWACINVPQIRVAMSPPVIAFAGIGAFILSIVAQRAALRLNVTAGLGLFMLYASLIGVALAPIWILYPQSLIGVAFLLTGGVFFTMSVVGFVTKIDLSKMQSILIMAAWGLLLASAVNLFFASSGLSWMVTYGVVIVFTGLIATQTQQLKEFALSNSDPTMAGRVAVLGALQLYITFINVFVSVLRILGSRK